MAQKTWRLVVTELGGSSTLHEVTVGATNWMSALKEGRAKIGEAGGVPTGASCAVAPDGKVTIHDPMARRTYVLTPDVATSFTRSKPTGPRIPVDEAAMAAEPAPKPRVSKKTVAYAVSPVAAGVSAPVGAQASPTPPPASAQQPAQPAAAQVAQPAPAPAAAPQPAPAPAAAPQPAPPAAAAPAPAPAAPKPAEALPSCELLSTRDEDPSEQSPLHYRERTFVVPEGTPKDVAEKALFERFEALRRELADEPPGKFFNFAVFDHRWEDRPKRPPVVALQWKDWRGDPEVSYPLEAKRAAKAAKQQPASAAPPPTAAPAPAQASAPAPSPAPAPAPAPSARPPARTRTKTDEQDARLAHAFEAAQDLFFLSTPAEGLDFAIRLLDELIPSEAASACLYDINTDEFRFVALSGPGADERKGEAIPSRTGLLGAAAERVGAAFLVADVTGDHRFDPGIDGRVGLELRNAMYMSLHHQGRLLGVLQLINRRDRDAFGQGDAEVIGYLGKQLSEFLYQARIAPDQGARI